MTAGRGVARREVEVVNERGLHARVAARIAAAAERFDADIRFACKGETVSALSNMGLLMLAATRGTRLEVSASGSDAAAAVGGVGRDVRQRLRGGVREPGRALRQAQGRPLRYAASPLLRVRDGLWAAKNSPHPE